MREKCNIIPTNKLFPFSYIHYQAQAALIYDSVFVLVEAFNKILKKKSDQFKTYTVRKTGNGLPTNVSKGLDCNPASASGGMTIWEHGDKISRYIRKVSVTLCHITLVTEQILNSFFSHGNLIYVRYYLSVSRSLSRVYLLVYLNRLKSKG